MSTDYFYFQATHPLAQLGLLRSRHDPCVYYKKITHNSIIFIAVVVDDIIAAATRLQTLRWLAERLRATYKITELGEPAYLVGLSISRDHSAITIHQNQFIRDLTVTFKQTQCNVVNTPEVPGDVAPGQRPQLPPNHHYLSLSSVLSCGAPSHALISLSP